MHAKRKNYYKKEVKFIICLNSTSSFYVVIYFIDLNKNKSKYYFIIKSPS